MKTAPVVIRVVAVVVVLAVVGFLVWRYFIWNGQDATLADYPYIVALENADGTHSCGGVLLTDEWVLTAGHCGNVATVRANSLKMDGNAQHQGGHVRTVVAECIHPAYDSTAPKRYDLRLIQVSSFGEDTPTTAALGPLQAAKVVAVGWGKDQHGTFAKVLQEVSTVAISDQKCTLNHTAFKGKIVTQHMCFGTTNHGSCYGDSGGPIVENGKVVGIISDGPADPADCNALNTWSTAIEVDLFEAWIKGVIGGTNRVCRP